MKIENIKFKAKRRDNGEWVEGDLMKESYGARIVEHTSKADNWLAVDPLNSLPVHRADRL